MVQTRIAVGTLCLLLVGGCSASTATVDASSDRGVLTDLAVADVPTCVLGTVQACGCLGLGNVGVQSCLGSSYGACVCPDAGLSSDIGIDGGTVPTDAGEEDGGVEAGTMVVDAVVGTDVGVDVAMIDTSVPVDTGVDVTVPDTGIDVPLAMDTAPRDVVTITDSGHDAGILPDVATADAGGAIAPPRLIAPISVTRVTSQRPTLHWMLPTGVTGAHVQLCSDRPCSHVLTTLDATGNSVRPTTALSPGVVFWRAYGRTSAGVGTTATPTWEFVVGHRDTPVDSSYGRIKDFDGDGYDDLAVDANGANSAPMSLVEGAVYIYRGSPSGLSTSPVELTTTFVYDLGTTALAAGDLNGDGLADLVTSNANDQPNGYLVLPEGSACVFYGRQGTGLPTTPDLTLYLPTSAIGQHMGYAMAVVHDINGDGFDDVAIADGLTAWLYRKPPITPG